MAKLFLDTNVFIDLLEGRSNINVDDFEDNVQLHCAAQANCDFFLTRDEKMLKLGFFGKVRLKSV